MSIKPLRKILLLSGAAGLSGLVWLLTEDTISKLRSEALIHKAASEAAKDKQKKEDLQKESKRYESLALGAERFQLYNPWSYLIKYAKTYYRNGNEAE